MRDYGFRDQKDFCTILNESTGGRPASDHALTIQMAKELCMIQRSAKGKKCREYFVSCEEAWNSPEKIMERAMQIAHRRALEAERRIFCLQEEKETLEVALNESLQYYTVAKYNKTFHMGWDMAKCQRIGKKLAIYCRSRAIEIRRCETNDERFGVVNSYPIAVWNDFVKSESQI
jgi:hypothetical protein